MNGQDDPTLKPVETIATPTPASTTAEASPTDVAAPAPELTLSQKIAAAFDGPAPEAAATQPDKPAEVIPASTATDKPTASHSADGKAVVDQAPLDEAALLEGVQGPQARERIQQLVARSKATEAELEGVKGKAAWADAMEGWMAHHELADSDVQEVLQLAAKMRQAQTGNVAAAQELQQGLQQVLQQLALMTGTKAVTIDPLADFPELRQQVDAMDLSLEHAVALAQIQRQKQQQAVRQKEQAEVQRQQAAEAAELKQTAAWITEMRKNDPDAEAKLKYIQDLEESGVVLVNLVQVQQLYKAAAGQIAKRPKAAPVSALPAPVVVASSANSKVPDLKTAIMAAL